MPYDVIEVGTAASSPRDIIAPVIDSGIDLATFAKDRYPMLPNLFFEKEKVVTHEASQTGFIVYKFKEAFGRLNQERALINNDGAIEWRDIVVNDPYTTVDGATTASTAVTVTDISDLLGIVVDSSITFVQTTSGLPEFIEATVTAISGNDITLNTALTLQDGARVYRGTYNRAPGCSPTITNKYTLRTPVKDVAYFRKIDTKLEFTKKELNTHRYSYELTPQGAQSYIEDFKMANVSGMLNEFKDAVYFDQNLADGNGVTPSGAAQTMGLIPKLQDVQDDYSIKTIHDLGPLYDDADPSTVHTMIQGFLDILDEAGQSGLYENGVITCLANRKQLGALQRLVPYMREYSNVQVMHSMGGDDINLQLPKIQYGIYTVEWMYEDFFDRTDVPMFIMVPKDQVLVRQQQYQYVGPDLKVRETSNAIDAKIGAGYPMIRCVDRTAVETTNLGDCFVFLMEFEFACGWRGTGTGAYHIGFNFAGPAESTILNPNADSADNITISV